MSEQDRAGDRAGDRAEGGSRGRGQDGAGARAPEPGAPGAIAGATTGATTGTPAPPVPEPTDERSARDLAALMFKPELDPARRLPEAPGGEPSPARAGTRPELPVVYGARPTPLDAGSADPAPAAAASRGGSGPRGASGPESDPVAETAARRAALPSIARQNARFRTLVLVGGPLVLVGAAAGIWAICAALLG